MKTRSCKYILATTLKKRTAIKHCCKIDSSWDRPTIRSFSLYIYETYIVQKLLFSRSMLRNACLSVESPKALFHFVETVVRSLIRPLHRRRSTLLHFQSFRFVYGYSSYVFLNFLFSVRVFFVLGCGRHCCSFYCPWSRLLRIRLSEEIR